MAPVYRLSNGILASSDTRPAAIESEDNHRTCHCQLWLIGITIAVGGSKLYFKLLNAKGLSSRWQDEIGGRAALRCD
jgi:hypothetical protein